MLRKQVNPLFVAIAVVLVLAAVQFLYWRALVYREPQAGGGGGGGAPPGGEPSAMGLVDARVETLAGGEPGFADGPAWKARFSGPNSLALLPDGSLLVVDSRNHRLRSISPHRSVTTLAGGGPPGGAGGCAVGPAADARFRFPSGVAAAPDGTIYIADTGNHRICRLRSGAVTALAGGTEGLQDGAGAGARFRYPAALALDPGGALWVADAGNRKIRRVDPSGQVTTPPPPAAIAAGLGEVTTGPRHEVLQAHADGAGLLEATPFRVSRLSPASGSADASLRVLADTGRSVLLARRGDGPPILLAGRVQKAAAVRERDGAGHQASFAVPCAAVMAVDGTAYVADYEGNRIRRVLVPGWFLNEEQSPGERQFYRRQLRGR